MPSPLHTCRCRAEQHRSRVRQNPQRPAAETILADRRTSPGLLVCLPAHDNDDRYGGLLKLQVVAPNAAVLGELASGKVKLSAVRDLLDKPGDLQKGAICTSWLADDRILVGDQLAAVPDLTEIEAADIAEKLAHRARPIGYIDTTKPATETIRTGGITISGAVADMRARVGISRQEDGRWLVAIDSEDEPRRTHP
jgi:hypothetical protein